MQIQAELRQTSQTKRASLDNVTVDIEVGE
jgi:hypothetical protein